MPDRIPPLSGRELREQHKAMVESGVPHAVRLRWLERETRRWFDSPRMSELVEMDNRVSGEPMSRLDPFGA